MRLKTALFLMFHFIFLCDNFAQSDSAEQVLQKLSGKYLKDTEKKIDRYTHRISNKTEKILTKLAKWESRVQRMLQKVSPAAAQKLFANEQTTFKGMLAQYKKGESQMKGSCGPEWPF